MFDWVRETNSKCPYPRGVPLTMLENEVSSELVYERSYNPDREDKIDGLCIREEAAEERVEAVRADETDVFRRYFPSYR